MLGESLPGIRLATICGSIALLAVSACHYFELGAIAAAGLALSAAGVVYLWLERDSVTNMIRQGIASQPTRALTTEHVITDAAG
jgi:hypothetical protein